MTSHDNVTDIVEQLQALHVWPQFVADTHADVISPRQAQGLYDVGNVATEAADTIASLRKQLANYEADAIHTCSANCQRPMCVLRKQLEDARAEGWAGLRTYGKHRTDCRLYANSTLDCTCGLTDAIRALKGKSC